VYAPRQFRRNVLRVLFLYLGARSSLLLALVLLFTLPICCWSANNFDDYIAKFASASVTPLAAAGEIGLYATGGKDGKYEAIQGAKALAATGLITELLKYTVREKRPDGSSMDSFPSGHTSEAFAMATVLSSYHPNLTWYAYPAAAIIGWSRVETDKHRWRDVAAGAIIGTVVAKQFAKQKHIYIGADGIGWKTSW